jgi:hypothetical protein
MTLPETNQSFHVEATMNREELIKAFIVDVIEVRNETKKPVWVTVAKSELTGRIFVKVFRDEGFEVKPNSYRLVPIEVVKT